MSKIVIGVACHKPSELPKSDIYLPIHVGSALAAKELPGLQRDDEGDNISTKNPMYCELTAQYWLWKNVDADYYGLSHYRRYMSFASERFTNFTFDKRKQVLCLSLNDYTQKKYCLDNADAMREIIEAHDIVATEEQDLSVVFTPRGHKRSVYEHFVAHDHDLINKHDLDNVISIVKERWPQYYDDMIEYIGKPYFRGFNCFVMKKDLFFELCEFEFDVLAELEKIIDVETYDLTRTRVYGFMAEILYSSFVYHVKKRRGVDVHDVQMLFFHDSDPKVELEPLPGATPVMFNLTSVPAFMFDVTLSSFLDNISQDRKYDIILCHDDNLTKEYKAYFEGRLEDHPNVSLRYLDAVRAADAYDEVQKSCYYLPTLYLPFTLRKFDRIAYFTWNVLFRDNVDNILDVDLQGKPLAAVYDIEWQGQCNAVFTEEKDEVTEYIGVEDPFKLFDTSVLVYDLKMVREAISVWDVLDLYLSYRDPIGDKAAMNVLFGGNIRVLPQRYNVHVATYYQFKQRISDAPLALYKEYQADSKAPYVISYDPYDPWWLVGAAHETVFWAYANKSPYVGMFNEQVTFVHTKMKGKRRIKGMARTYIDEVLPEGSKRRQFVFKMAPRGSAQQEFAKNISRRIINFIK